MILQEISADNAKKALQFAEEVDPEELPFDSIFGNNRWRRVFDFPSRVDSNSTIGEIVKFFQKNDHQVDLSQGTTTYSYEIPAGPKEGEMTTSTSKIGKRLNGLESFMESFVEEFTKLSRRAMEEPDDYLPGAADPGFEEIYEPLQDLIDSYTKIYPSYQDLLGILKYFSSDGGYAREFREKGKRATSFKERRVQEWINYWNANSKEIINNPGSVYKDYKIIFSRHPVDLLRMSDHEGIDTCQSEGDSHFACTLAEMRANGAIAYLVEEEELESVSDLQRDEIFADPQRDVPGIVPDARTRLRRVANLDEKMEFALPNNLVYGDRVTGFAEKVANITEEHQEGVLEYLRERGELESREFALWGGEYTDAAPLVSFIEDFVDAEIQGNVLAQKGGDPEFTNRPEWIQKRLDLEDKLEDMGMNGAEISIKESMYDGESQRFFQFSDIWELEPPNEKIASEYLNDSWHLPNHFPQDLRDAVGNAARNIIDAWGAERIQSAMRASHYNPIKKRNISSNGHVYSILIPLSVRSDKLRLGRPGAGADQHHTVMTYFFHDYKRLRDAGDIFVELVSKELREKGYFEKKGKMGGLAAQILKGENPFDHFVIVNNETARFQPSGEEEYTVGTTFNYDTLDWRTTLRRKAGGLDYRIENLFTQKINQLLEQGLGYVKKQLKLFAKEGPAGYEKVYQKFQDFQESPYFSLMQPNFEPASGEEGGNTIPVKAQIQAFFGDISESVSVVKEAKLALIRWLDDHPQEVLKAANEALQIVNQEALESARASGEEPSRLQEGVTMPPPDLNRSEQQLAALVREFLYEEGQNYR